MIAARKELGTLDLMATTQTTRNGNLNPKDVTNAFLEAVDDTHRRLDEGLDATELHAELGAELTRLASHPDAPDRTFALRACALLGVALADGVGTGLDASDVDRYYDDMFDDLIATVSATVSLLPELGRGTVAAAMRRMLTQAAAAMREDPWDRDYASELFLATANAVALAATDG